jgi:hypothetical protein
MACAATPSPDGGRTTAQNFPPRDLLRKAVQGTSAARSASEQGGNKAVFPEGKTLLVRAGSGTLDGRAQLAEGRLFGVLTKGEDG